MHSKMRHEVMRVYDVRVKDFGDGLIEFSEYSKSLLYKDPSYEACEEIQSFKGEVDFNFSSTSLIKKDVEEKKDNKKEIRKNNLNRSFMLLTDLVLSNRSNLKTFITLTFKDNIKDLTYANKTFNNYCKAVRKHYPDFMYIGVPEFQKRGAVHYHILTNLSLDACKAFRLQDNEENKYDAIQWSHGFSSVFDLSMTDEKFNISAYMGKYFFKDIDNRLFGRQKVLRSQNCKKPIISRLRKLSDEYDELISKVSNMQLISDKTVISKSYEVMSINYKIFKSY